MKKILFSFYLILLAIATYAQSRIVQNFNDNWQFYLGDEPQAKNLNFNTNNWRTLALPHDWSIESDFKAEFPARNDGGALPGGIAWYRKTFTVDASKKDQLFYIQFDGIYKHSEVWINGQYLGKRANGYISFQYEISKYLNFGNTPNTIAVRVDNSQQPDSRWYTGSGIYRNVYLISTNKIAVENYGTFITTPSVNGQQAKVNVATEIKNAGETKSVKVEVGVYKAGKLVEKNITSVEARSSSVTKLNQSLTINNPVLWSPEKPNLYEVITRIYDGNKQIDEVKNPLGLRSFRFDADKGFFLNEQSYTLFGVCLHHDLGALGSAMNTRALERQLQIMKDMGANAIRTAHNPPAPEVLQLCDKMGFLVMDEAFDMWKKRKNKFDYHVDFEANHKQDLEDLVKRDRNHPSVFMWSIGNEIREQFDATGTVIAKELSAIVKSIDPTRPVIAALTETEPEKNFIFQSKALDVLGFNYKYFDYDSLPKRFQGYPLLASETVSALATRGVYDLADTLRLWPASSKDKYVVGGNPDFTVTAYDNVAAYWGTTHEIAWKEVKKRPFMSGTFVWTGFDYLGEPVPYPFPARSSYYGIVDLAGFPKDVYYMYQSEWTDKPVLHVLPHWNWKAGEEVSVWAYYSQADEVELFVNGKSKGIKRKEDGDDLHVSWKVPFEAGSVKVVSRKGGKTVLEKEVKTAGSAYKIQLIADRNNIKADGKDLSFITAQIVDKDGNIVPDADHLIKFTITGKGAIVGTDNGYQADLTSLSKPERKAFKGKALAIVKSQQNEKGNIVLKAAAEGLEGASVVVKAVK
ncbi:glycoside hydrolase family 2 sugar binding protein [Pseudopedobacter saltans DSM 12145]|uniref:Glycoside hydrolase family 2 sugar binding protein n=1 Tax=Pseudopedobacter saltans (strain ATCC 51119 / DSM 12145 / JCM 21818 / CCUG 39354 / LMG 10337 / NBRC 100064 / NCIMB 13643) TaxID=762903 RepID=F0SBP8_PSESL|nr:glycoside hydrolase family 2 TIM barrel-domain containing protein [Pseudopedobacter saltans]ADY52739.1 glycoside hydrolase family 2 sugar binding protein [Pseudopedobacter saltans DSM 12145]